MVALSEIAQSLGCSRQNVQKLIRRGMPRHSVQAAKEWHAANCPRSRRHQDKPSPPPVAAASDVDSTSKGAARMLDRLEEAEAAAHSAFQDAQKTGDPIQLATARNVWLQTCRELRYLDRDIAVERRDSDEQIAKSEATEALGKLVAQVTESLFRAIDTISGIREFTELEPHARRKAIRQATCDRFKVALYAHRKSWPKWAFDIVNKSIGHEYFSDAEIISLERQFQEVCENGPTEADQAEADKRRSDAYNALQYMDADAPAWRHYAYDENGKIKTGYGWSEDSKGFSHLVWRGPGECPGGLRPGEAIINGKVVMVDPTIAPAVN